MPKLIVVLVPVAFALAPACSASDPGSPVPKYGSQHGSGGTSGGSGGGGGSGSGSGDYDAGAPPVPVHFDSGAPTPSRDAGGGVDASAPTQPQSAPGTCGNPVCGGDGAGDCGCVAHDSQGARIELGCSGGVCACFTNGQQTTSGVNDNGACNSVNDMQTQFAIDCACN